MCGIGGWLGKDGWCPSKNQMSSWLLAIEHRGKDATGYATLTPEGPVFAKMPRTATQFVEAIKKEPIEIGQRGILHTRAKTIGSEKDNTNNHPILYNEVLIVHNGSVNNTDAAYKKLGIERIADVDSAIIAGALGLLGPIKGLKFLEEMCPGSAAIAAMWNDGSMLLARDGKPLSLGILPHNNSLMWLSELDDLARMCRDSNGWSKVRELDDFSYEYYDKDGKLADKGSFVLRVPNFTRGTGGNTASGGSNIITTTHRSQANTSSPAQGGSNRRPAGFFPRPYQSDLAALPAHYRNQVTTTEKNLVPTGTPGGNVSSSGIGEVVSQEIHGRLVNYCRLDEDVRPDNQCEWGRCKKWGYIVLDHDVEWIVICKAHAKQVLENGHWNIPRLAS